MPFTGLKNLPHIRLIVYAVVGVSLAIVLNHYGLWGDILQLGRDLLSGAGLIDQPVIAE